MMSHLPCLTLLQLRFCWQALVGQVQGVLAASGWLAPGLAVCLPRGGYRRLLGDVRRAESLARRIAILLALALPAPALAFGKATRQPAPVKGSRRMAGALQRLALTEPLLASNFDALANSATRQPGYSLTDEDEAVVSRQLGDRLAALAAFADDPGRDAARMARWLARTAAAAERQRCRLAEGAATALRAIPIRSVRPPGAFAPQLSAPDPLWDSHRLAIPALDAHALSLRDPPSPAST